MILLALIFCSKPYIWWHVGTDSWELVTIGTTTLAHLGLKQMMNLPSTRNWLIFLVWSTCLRHRPLTKLDWWSPCGRSLDTMKRYTLLNTYLPWYQSLREELARGETYTFVPTACSWLLTVAYVTRISILSDPTESTLDSWIPSENQEALLELENSHVRRD